MVGEIDAGEGVLLVVATPVGEASPEARLSAAAADTQSIHRGFLHPSRGSEEPENFQRPSSVMGGKEVKSALPPLNKGCENEGWR